MTNDPESRVPGPDDTAAFQGFYSEGPAGQQPGLLYRLLIGWWRDRR